MIPSEKALCPACAAKLQPDHYFAYCPHEKVLAIAEPTENGIRYVTFSPLTLDEAQALIRLGIISAAEKFESQPRH